MSTLYTTVAAVLLAAPLSGAWRVSLHERDGVEIDFRMTVEQTESGRWEAWSRAGAAREIVGGGKAALGRILGKMPPHEALMAVVDGTLEASGTLKGTLESPFLGRRELVGRLGRDGIHAELRRASGGALAGSLDAVRDPTDRSYRDYPALAASLVAATRENLFDPGLLERPEWQRYFQELTARFAVARDDLDVLAAFQALRPELGTSHLEFIRNPSLAARSLEEVLSGQPTVEDPVRLSFPAPGIAFLRVRKWDRVTEAIDHAFERMASDGARVLLLDVRGNPGGDATSMAALGHLLREPVAVGVFLSAPWYRQHARPPSPEEIATLPVLDTDASPLRLITDLRSGGAVVGKALPRAPHFAGPVYLLIDGGTASASEPLVHALRASGRATLVGERTAGHMLLALPHSLPEGWVAVVPEADFVAADGTRLEGRGIEPQVKCASDQVFLQVADRLERELPFSAALLRGGSYEGLKKTSDALRAYRAALQAAGRQTPPPTPAMLAATHKRIAALLAEKGDEEGARRAREEATRLLQ
jgi:carboxyl-terminal processing protease